MYFVSVSGFCLSFFSTPQNVLLIYSSMLEMNKLHYLKNYGLYLFLSLGSEREKEKNMRIKLRKEVRYTYVHREPIEVSRGSRGLRLH